jgi:hypothetical protein
MKRSRIFLGITTGVLAVVAFTAAKSAKFNNHHAAGYYSVNNGDCIITGGGATGYTTGSGKGNQVFTANDTKGLYERSTGHCANKIYQTAFE